MEIRDLIFNFIQRHHGHTVMSVKTYKTELAKYTLDKMRPNDVCQKKIDYFKEELRQSRENHARRVQRCRDDERDLAGYDDTQLESDGQGGIQPITGQRKDPSTHPRKPQELKIATKVAPVSTQSIKNDDVISRGTPSFISHYVKLNPKK